MLRTLGCAMVESSEEWPTVGWETLARANPTWLIIARMDRRRFPPTTTRRSWHSCAATR